MEITFAWVAAAFYALGVAYAYSEARRSRPHLPRKALGALGVGLLAHAISIASLAIVTRRFPVADIHTALSFFAFLLIIAFFLAYWRYRAPSLGLFMLPLVLLVTVISALRPDRTFESPAFRSGWLWAHVAASILGYAGFSITFAAAVMYLLQERQLKSRRPRGFYYRLPPLETCERIYYGSLLFGFPFLSAGLIMGFVDASREWHGAWEFDPKILASVLTWIVYLVLFSAYLSGIWRGRRAAYVAIFAFAILMVTFLGVSFVSGQHGYFPKLGNIP